MTAARSIELDIERLGARGDGIARWQGAPVYVDGALAGETVRARLAGKRGDGQAAIVEEIVVASPERRAAPCSHAASCGGCALQHASDAAYRVWKGDILTAALARRGIEGIDIHPLAIAPRESRRRARLGIGHHGNHAFAGFRARQSHRLVQIDGCLVLSPALMTARDRLEPLLGSLDVTEIELTETATGVDVILHGKALPALEPLERITAAAHEFDLARMSWRGRDGLAPLVVRRTPELAFGSVRVAVPPGAFVQPTKWGEEVMAAHVADILAASRQPADLFAGLGSFAFRLAPDRAVTAVEGHAAMTAAMTEAANRSEVAGRFSVQTRDLAHAPLTAEELDPFDAVVFDPPRQGAREQSLQIAASNVPLVVAVSCHPASFGRDARILIDGGYRLDTIWPIDQFLWSHHLELVAVFRRG